MRSIQADIVGSRESAGFLAAARTRQRLTSWSPLGCAVTPKLHPPEARVLG